MQLAIAISAVLSFVLDVIIGDPDWIIHPVVIIGKGIEVSESYFRSACPKTDKGERLAGLITAIVIPVITFLFFSLVLFAAYVFTPIAAIVLNIIFGCHALAYKGLMKESMNVHKKLETGTIVDARMAVSRIVGRDTENLTRDEVIKADIETVAENFSDGIIAPLFYLFIGGAPLAMAYKAINTMDSMIGYKNERYLYFGRSAARLDDIANFIPARISAFLLIMASFFRGYDTKKAFLIWRRDRRKHASPNSAQTESVMAGALGIRLAGPASYFGEYHDKPYIGDADKLIKEDDILRANRLVTIASIMGVFIFALIRVAVIISFG